MIILQKRTVIRTNAYYDSVTLMRISSQAEKLEGVTQVMVGMGTQLNKEALDKVGLLSSEAEKAEPNDLMLGVEAEDRVSLDDVFEAIDKLISSRSRSEIKVKEKSYGTIEEAVLKEGGFNLAVISIPGAYAAREAKHALNNGIHVFLFSDNVSIEQERELKSIAQDKGLLMMGADCGTAIINGIPLGFANRVRRGNVGIIGASGTGTQQVTTLLHELGAGVSQVIGTGGRDMSSYIGGKMTLAALDALQKDEATEVIVIISKPPSPEVAESLLRKAGEIDKVIILCLMGAKPYTMLKENTVQCFNLEETALKAAEASLGRKVYLEEEQYNHIPVESFKSIRSVKQKYIRALYGGGTLCDEAMMLFRKGNIPMYSNIPLNENEALKDINKSIGNTFLDMGEDYFTRGKPHPMIEPSLRNKRLMEEAMDEETAVILVDVELGHGCHRNPAGVVADCADEINKRLYKTGRSILWIAAVVGTDMDPQNMEEQLDRLKKSGFVVFKSNIRAASLAAEFVQEGGESIGY